MVYFNLYRTTSGFYYVGTGFDKECDAIRHADREVSSNYIRTFGVEVSAEQAVAA